MFYNGLNMVRAALYSIFFFGFGIFKLTNIFLGTTNCGMHYICCVCPAWACAHTIGSSE